MGPRAAGVLNHLCSDVAEMIGANPSVIWAPYYGGTTNNVFIDVELFTDGNPRTRSEALGRIVQGIGAADESHYGAAFVMRPMVTFIVRVIAQMSSDTSQATINRD